MKNQAGGCPFFSYAVALGWGCVCLLFPLQVLAGPSASVNLGATISQGTCDATVSTPAVNFAISSQDVKSDAGALATSPATLTLKCVGFASALTPKLTVSGSQDGDLAGTFNYRNDSSSKAFTALVFRVQYTKLGDAAGTWTGPLAPGDYDATMSTTDFDMSGKAIALQFTMWCAPGTGQTIENCKETYAGGSVSLGVNYP